MESDWRNLSFYVYKRLKRYKNSTETKLNPKPFLTMYFNVTYWSLDIFYYLWIILTEKFPKAKALVSMY